VTCVSSSCVSRLKHLLKGAYNAKFSFFKQHLRLISWNKIMFLMRRRIYNSIVLSLVNF